MQTQVIIVAGGSGKRMGNSTPKQFLLLCGKPVLMHTIQKFRETLNDSQITIVLPKEHIPHWKTLVKDYHFTIPHQIVEGGSERFYSVKNALGSFPPNFEGIVAIHDGVRPLVSSKTILNAVNECKSKKAVIPVITLNDSLRKTDGINSIHQNRSDYRLVQTPQCFDFNILKKAYEQAFSPIFTDDASVVEGINEKVWLVDGNVENIKITTPLDLIIAEALIKNQLNNE